MTLTFDDAPGDVPLDVVVSTLQVKLSSDTLLVDPSFGHILLTEVRWPEGWGEGKEKNSGVGGGVARSREHAQLEEEEEREEEEEAAGGSRGRYPLRFRRFGVRRAATVSSRVLAHALRGRADGICGVGRGGGVLRLAVFVARENRVRVQGEMRRRPAWHPPFHRIMTHHKPGAVGLVKGFRATRRNLVKSELRQFWVNLARLLAADGRIDVLSYDASRCVPTQRLLEEIGDLIRVPVRTCDAAVVTLGGDVATGGVDAAVLEDEEAFDAGSSTSTRDGSPRGGVRPRKIHVRDEQVPRKGGGETRRGIARGRGLAPVVVEHARGSGLRPTALRDPDADRHAINPELDADDPELDADEYAIDPELDPELAAANRSSRLAASRAREETRRKLALLRNPADLLREVTAAGGSGGGVSRVDAGGMRRHPQPVPIIPTEKLVAARDAATGYDPRLDRYAADRAADSKKSRTNSRRRRRDRGARRGWTISRWCRISNSRRGAWAAARPRRPRSARHARGGERRPARERARRREARGGKGGSGKRRRVRRRRRRLCRRTPGGDSVGGRGGSQRRPARSRGRRHARPQRSVRAHVETAVGDGREPTKAAAVRKHGHLERDARRAVSLRVSETRGIDLQKVANVGEGRHRAPFFARR